MITKRFIRYMNDVAPEMETERKQKALLIFKNCLKHKNDIVVELDKQYFDMEDKLPIIIAKKFQKLFFKDCEERTEYELQGKFVLGGCSEHEINESFFPYFFEKGTVKAELIEKGKLSNDTLFLDLLTKCTGETVETETLILYKTYSHEMDKAMNKVLNCFLESVIRNYAKGILKHPYEQYEDIKEVVNVAVMETIGYISVVSNFKSCDEFGRFVGWSDKTVNDILELAKEEII